MGSGNVWSFDGPTAPFFDGHGEEPARFVLRQIDDDRFVVEEPVLYDDGAASVRIPPNEGVPTDLASIPFFMAWFVPVNGRHTPAALVHDTMLDGIRGSLRSGDIAPSEAARLRTEADDVFLVAMAATGVPLLRRGLMHAAVTMATSWTRSWWSRLALVLWTIGSVVGSVMLVASLLTGWWWITVAAMVAPIPASLLWGNQSWRSGVLAGYGAWLIGLPALATAVGYGAYWLAEQSVRPLAARHSGEAVSDSPPPAPYR